MANKTASKAKVKTQENGKSDTQIPPGAVPQLVNQRVYDYLPAFFEAMKEMNANLAAIRKSLED